MPSQLEPALIDWCLHGRSTEHGWRATLVDLARRGHVRVEPVQEPEIGSRTRTFRLIRTRSAAAPWEAAVLELLFGDVGKDVDEVTTGALWSWTANREHGCRRWWAAWSQLVAKEGVARLAEEAPGRTAGMLQARKREREVETARVETGRRWFLYADQLAAVEELPESVPGELERWGGILVSLIPLDRHERLARLLDAALTPEQREELTAGWCPLGPPDRSVAAGLWALLRALPANLLAGA